MRTVSLDDIRAGMIVRYPGSDDMWLIGNANDAGGICDDCPAFGRGDITLELIGDLRSEVGAEAALEAWLQNMKYLDRD